MDDGIEEVHDTLVSIRVSGGQSDPRNREGRTYRRVGIDPIPSRNGLMVGGHHGRRFIAAFLRSGLARLLRRKTQNDFTSRSVTRSCKPTTSVS